jgi:protein TonB
MSGNTQKPSRHRLFIGILLAIVLAGGVGSFFIKGSDRPVRKATKSTIVNITLPPPPPPLPPPPPQSEPPPQEEQKMVEADPVVEEAPPEEAPAPEEPPAELTTNLAGGTGNDFGLKQGSGRGNFGNGGQKMIGGGGSKWGRYNAGLSRTIEEALKRHPATRNAKFPGTRTVLWLDSTGRILRAKLLDSTRTPSVDSAISNEILPGLIYQPQPADMPSPIVVRITGR